MIAHSHQRPSLKNTTLAVLIVFFVLSAGLFSVIWAKQITFCVLPIGTTFGHKSKLLLSKGHGVKEHSAKHVDSFNPDRINSNYKNSNKGILFSDEKGYIAFSQKGTLHLRAIWNKASYSTTISYSQNKHKFNTID